MLIGRSPEFGMASAGVNEKVGALSIPRANLSC